MQCPSCGTENPSNNRFCGMCGATLAQKPRLEPNPYFSDRIGPEPALKQEFAGPDAKTPERAIRQTETSHASEPPRQRVTSPVPVTSKTAVAEALPDTFVERRRPGSPAMNPIFERRHSPAPNSVPSPGTSQVAAEPTERVPEVKPEPVPAFRQEFRPEPVVIGGSSMLGLGAPSTPLQYDGSGEYLLDDRPRRTISWRAWALLLFLVGLGYLGWRQWTVSHQAAPDVSKILESGQPLSPDTPVQNTDNGKSTADKSTPNTPESDKPATTGKTASAPDAANSAATKKAGDDADPSASANDTGKNASENGAANTTKRLDRATDTSSKAVKSKTERADNAGTDDEGSTPAKSEGKTVAKEAPALDYAKDPMYLRAQQYIHGKPQNCDMGLNYLKASAEENPKAQIQMAALYESGVCVPMDRAQAYHWFSKAQNNDPHNMWLEKSRTRLWAQMTPEERSRAH